MNIRKYVDIPKLSRRMLLLSWIMILAMVLGKMIFNISFPLYSNNKLFNDICDYIDNHSILKYIIMFIFYIINSNIFYLICTKANFVKNKLYLLIINILFSLCFVVKYFSNLFGCILELVNLLALSIYYNFKNKIFEKEIWNVLLPIFSYIMVNLWQICIFFIRDNNILLSENITFILIIMQIDYYIFLLLILIGVKFMGLCGIGWLWGKSETELKALKEKELSKNKPNAKLIEEIDEALNELKTKRKKK